MRFITSLALAVLATGCTEGGGNESATPSAPTPPRCPETCDPATSKNCCFVAVDCDTLDNGFGCGSCPIEACLSYSSIGCGRVTEVYIVRSTGDHTKYEKCDNESGCYYASTVLSAECDYYYSQPHYPDECEPTPTLGGFVPPVVPQDDGVKEMTPGG